ncbi:MAG: HipA family kinase [Wenzhouxiangella sp.]
MVSHHHEAGVSVVAPMAIEIVEVIRRSEQGITRPFICRGDDGETYFVKGRDAGRRSLICEWIAGQLGLAMKLPLAPFAIVNVPAELIASGGMPELADLGAGPAFGSMRREAMELNAATVQLVPAALQRDVLAFDWWIRNPDRYLTGQGGNPNLFWDPASEELIVIDHNQAFVSDFDRESFLDLHVFADQVGPVFRDIATRADYNHRFSAALENWERIQSSIPESWFFSDPEQTVPAGFDLEAVYRWLLEFRQPDFWERS